MTERKRQLPNASDTYLGDGAYASFDHERGLIRVYTFDGVTVRDEVFLEPQVWRALQHFAGEDVSEVAAADHRAHIEGEPES